jgi:subtilisin family serine protease
LRNGHGIIFVKAAGNEYIDVDTEGADCSRANTAKVTCENANAESDQAMPQVLVVGAVNASGVKSSYSSAGSNLLVTGLGGEFGVRTVSDINSYLNGAAIVTTDLAGCSRGSVRFGNTAGNTANPFDNTSSEINRLLNPDCDYTATMNGTSAATPTVAGVVALILHANPQLSWRDVRFILMKTARHIDASRVPNEVTLPSGESYVPEPAWTQNGAGLWFDNWYGFGLVDAAAAVSMAKQYTSYLTGPMLTDDPVEAEGAGCGTGNASCGTDIPVGTAGGLTVDLSNTSSTVKKIEAVQITLQLGATSAGDLAVELTSPSGTHSVLLNAFSTLSTTPSDINQFLLASYAFNEEPAQGTWELRLIDVGDRDNAEPGRFQSVKIQILGH